MFNNADVSLFDHVYIICGYTDLRLGIPGLALKIREELHMDPFENSLFLFCGRKKDWIKALHYEEDGYLLLYKRLIDGKFRWPQNEEAPPCDRHRDKLRQGEVPDIFHNLREAHKRAQEGA